MNIALRTIGISGIAWAVLLGGVGSCRVDLVRAREAESERIDGDSHRWPVVPREFRGVWVATVANIDWPSKPGLSAEQQKRELIRLIDQAAAVGLNAIVLQVRPMADALYPSQLEPWSEYLTGQMGKPPSEPYDPLALAVAEAHRRGLELHAWFNPYRAHHPAANSQISEQHISNTHPEWVRAYGKYLWLDPGERGAVDHSLAVIMDVVTRYDIDGVHLDDYFYPYPIRDDAGKKVPFPDDASWTRVVEDHDPSTGPLPSRDDWRRQNVDRFIQRLYREIKQRKPWVKFGISPFGIWRPGHPPQIAGFDQYSELYADARKWLVEGWLDYMTPQLYWKIEPPAQSYPVLLSWWHRQNAKQRHLWPGNYTSRVGFDASGAWQPDEILSQIEITRREPGATGNVHFSMKPLMKNTAGVADALREGPYQEPALVPATPWLSDPAFPMPAAPTLEIQKQDDKRVLQITSGEGPAPWLFVVRLRSGDHWETEIIPGGNRDYPLPDAGRSSQWQAVAVSQVDRLGQEGPVAELELPIP